MNPLNTQLHKNVRFSQFLNVFPSKCQTVDEYRKSCITYSKENDKTYDGKQNYQRTKLQNNELHNYKYLIN